MYGPPDKVGKFAQWWLVHPGPPMACHLVHYFPMPESERLDYYHAHPHTWSLHIILEGHGFYYADGKRHEIGPGSVQYHGPGVPHCGPFPAPNTEMKMLVVFHPANPHRAGEWVVVPEAGLADKPFDEAAFHAKYPNVDLKNYIDSFPAFSAALPSQRWAHYCDTELTDSPTKQK
jgi:mannose-6-phosphate isomerase-like protein (cupin superfamily)